MKQQFQYVSIQLKEYNQYLETPTQHFNHSRSPTKAAVFVFTGPLHTSTQRQLDRILCFMGERYHLRSIGILCLDTTSLETYELND